MYYHNFYRQVSTEEGQNMAKALGMSFFEVSAKTGENVTVLFDELTIQLQESSKDNNSIIDNQKNFGMEFISFFI